MLLGKYEYSPFEKDLNKVLKDNQMKSASISHELNRTRMAAEKAGRTADSAIADAEALLKSLGVDLPSKRQNVSLTSVPSDQSVKPAKTNAPIDIPNWEEIVASSRNNIAYDVELENILSKSEFEQAYREIDKINLEFKRQTQLGKQDASFLIFATALQVIRWAVLPVVSGIPDRISSSDGDKLVEPLKQEFIQSHKDWPHSKFSQGHLLRQQEGKTWKEIVFSSVPYDVTRGFPSFSTRINMEGSFHRYKTLGHDPILGWIFGTANILTDTITLNNLSSYRVVNKVACEPVVLLPTVFYEAVQVIRNDWHMLPAAVFRQMVHLKSDKYTINGLPLPLLGVFNEDVAGSLYHSHYDLLCLEHDMKVTGRVVSSALLSTLIDTIIGLIHGLYFDESMGNRTLYEARTRKILMISHSLSSSFNLIYTGITADYGKLDLGGLLVTICNLFSNVRFITRLKQEYIEANRSEEWKRINDEIDQLLYGLSTP